MHQARSAKRTADRDASLTSASASNTEIQDRVLRVAARLFAQRGYHAVSVRDIATECGVSVSTVLYRGRSKHDLLDQILGRSFSGESSWTHLIAHLDASKLTTRQSFLATYDHVVEALVRHAIEYPYTRRLWLRLLLDKPELFETFEAKYTWPLFRYGFELLRAAREQGILQADDDRIQHFVAGIDWTLNGFFCGGILGFDGRRLDSRCPQAVTRLVDYLKEYCRVWFPAA